MSVSRGEAMAARAVVSSSLHQLHAAGAGAEDFQQFADFAGDFFQFLLDLLPFQPGQALQAQFQDAAGLLFRQAHRAFGADHVAGLVDQGQQGADIGGGPVAVHQRDAGGRGVGAGADQPDHLVDVGHRDGQADQVVGPLPCLAQLIPGAAEDHLLAEGDEAQQRVLQPHQPRAAAVQRQHVDAEADLKLGEAEQLVQHHLGGGVALQLDDDAHAGAVAFVAHAGHALDLLGADQLADAFQQGALVHLIRDFREHDGLAAAAHVLELGAGADGDAAAAGLERLPDAGAAEHDAAGGEVRAGDDADQLFQRGVRVGDQRHGGVDDLAGVVRRDIGGHADGDAVAAVDQQVGEAGGKDLGFGFRLVIVRLEIDRVLVDVGQQQGGGAGEPHFRVPHRCRVIAVHRAEIALPVHQRHAHGEGLCHAHHGVVDRGVAVRVILTHDVADDAGRFSVVLVRRVAGLMHAEEDPSVHRLQPVARIRQGAGDDHAHGVVEVGASHLLLDRHGVQVFRGRRRGRGIVWGVAQNPLGSVVAAAPEAG